MSQITQEGEWYLIAGKKGESINKTVLELSDYSLDAELGVVSMGNDGINPGSQTYTSVDAANVGLFYAVKNGDGNSFAISNWGKITNLDEELGESVGVWVLTKSPPSTYTFINFGFSETSDGSLFSGELLPSVSDTFTTNSWNDVKNAVTPTKPDGSYIDTFGRLSFLVGSNNNDSDKDLYIFQKGNATDPIELKINTDSDTGLECVDFYYDENDSDQNYLLVCSQEGLFYKLDNFSDLNNPSSISLSNLSSNMNGKTIWDITWINKSQTYQPRWYFACSDGVWYCDDLEGGEIQSLSLPSDWNNAIVYGISSTISLNNDKPRTTPLAVFSNYKANFTLDENGPTDSWAGFGGSDGGSAPSGSFENARKGVLIELNNNVVQVYISTVKSVQGTIDRANNTGSVEIIEYGDSNLNIRSEALTYLPTGEGGNGQLAFGTGTDQNVGPPIGVIYMSTKNGVITGDVSNLESVGESSISDRITALSLI